MRSEARITRVFSLRGRQLQRSITRSEPLYTKPLCALERACLKFLNGTHMCFISPLSLFESTVRIAAGVGVPTGKKRSMPHNGKLAEKRAE